MNDFHRQYSFEDEMTKEESDKEYEEVIAKMQDILDILEMAQKRDNLPADLGMVLGIWCTNQEGKEICLHLSGVGDANSIAQILLTAHRRLGV